MLEEAFAIEEILKEVQQHRENFLGDLSGTMSPSILPPQWQQNAPYVLGHCAQLRQCFYGAEVSSILSTPARQGRRSDSTQLLGGA